MCPCWCYPSPIQVALYLRISEDPFKLQAGVSRQRADCTRIALARWPDATLVEYVDKDVSASRYARRAKRPAFTALCNDLSSHAVDAIVGWNFDRLFRQPRELESFLDLCDAHNFQRVVTAQGDVDLTTDDGKLHARIMVAVAAKESDDKSRRIKRAVLSRREAGQHHGGRIVFGYQLVNKQPVIVPHAAQWVKEAAELVLSGVSLTEVARRAPKGAPRTKGGVRAMLLSPTLTGRNSGGLGGWPPILSDQTAAELRALLLARDRAQTAPSGKRRWWLSGLVRCGLDGGYMRAGMGGHGRPDRAYFCESCFGVSINAALLHWHVETALLSVAVEVPTHDLSTSSVEPEGESPSGRLADLAALYVAGGITREEWVSAREYAMAVSEPTPVVLTPMGDLVARWGGLTVEQRHEQASRHINRVVVARRVVGGKRWQPERIQIEWKD